MSFQNQISLNTKGHGDMKDITEQVAVVVNSNGHSHLQATLLGLSLTVPIADGKLVLGTWQQIFHLECDVRGRKRTVLVTVVGD
jgi:thiamine phosphate synthase YjbQ (UPF0047 family)